MLTWQQSLGFSRGKETFSCDALGLINRDRKREKRSKRKEASISKKHRRGYTLPAPSATQAESTPKIKYTLHLAKCTVWKTEHRQQTYKVIKCGWRTFFFFFHHSKSAANQTDGDFNCHRPSGFILNSKCATLTLRVKYKRHGAAGKPSVQTVFQAHECYKKYK